MSSTRQLAAAAPAGEAASPWTACLNCGGWLHGPYCAACGQRHDPQVHSLAHFASEAAEAVTHADSRLWRTLAALLLRPGRLTREFFAGRRARYLPPLRLYLVVSVTVFLLAALLPSERAAVAAAGADLGIVDSPGGCRDLNYDGPGAAWINPRLHAGCDKIARQGSERLVEQFTHNLPRALFLLLPLFALCMKPLYWRPRRHYVEHLLLLVHNHTLVFVALAALLLVEALLPWPAAVTALKFTLALLLPWYFYRSMRTVYGQSRTRTAAKFVALGGVYLVLAAILLALTGIFSVVAL
ncbi:MAG: DUF3667 domain-containing protein [Steroidobacteraceae bacterium]